MRNLNRVIAAGALVVPMALGASGAAMADVAAGSSGLPTQIRVSEDGGSDDCDGSGHCDDSKHCDKDNGDDGIGLLEILFGGGDSGNGDCEEDRDRGEDGKEDGNGLGLG